jgi:thymidylate synthase (FAD)
MMEYRRDVLDHGFVEVDDYFGSDLDIARIARVSTGKGNKTPEEDAKFIAYLYRHRHWSPFEMPVLRFKVQMPIFVARQWGRHRTHSMNEYSGRYSEMLNDHYLPEVDRLMYRDTDNRQASGGVRDPERAKALRDVMSGDMLSAGDGYKTILAGGVSKELARTVLPMSTYTLFFWQQNLRNLLGLLEQRLHPHAQWEIREFAQAVFDLTKQRFPLTCAAFEAFTLNAATFSEDELDLLREALRGSPELEMLLAMAEERLPKSRYREFVTKLEAA